MVTIMCTNPWRQALNKAGEKRRVTIPRTRTPGGRMGNWVATFVQEGLDAVVSHNVETSLTLVFPFPATGGIRRALAARLLALFANAVLRRRSLRRNARG
jgi:hypothetical protein